MSKQLAIVVDLDRCIGCRGCQAACKLENDVPLGVSRNHTYTMGPVGTFPRLSMYFLTLMCQQCKNPVCEAVCPTGACYKSVEDGVVSIDPALCIGCQSCAKACPYRACSFNPEKRIVDKCDLCAAARKDGDLPACVKNCPGGALRFGDVSDPDSDVGRLLAANSGRVFALKDEKGAGPSGRFILRRETWIDELPHEFERMLREGNGNVG